MMLAQVVARPRMLAGIVAAPVGLARPTGRRSCAASCPWPGQTRRESRRSGSAPCRWMTPKSWQPALDLLGQGGVVPGHRRHRCGQVHASAPSPPAARWRRGRSPWWTPTPASPTSARPRASPWAWRPSPSSAWATCRWRRTYFVGATSPFGHLLQCCCRRAAHGGSRARPGRPQPHRGHHGHGRAGRPRAPSRRPRWTCCDPDCADCAAARGRSRAPAGALSAAQAAPGAAAAALARGRKSRSPEERRSNRERGFAAALAGGRPPRCQWSSLGAEGTPFLTGAALPGHLRDELEAVAGAEVLYAERAADLTFAVARDAVRGRASAAGQRPSRRSQRSSTSAWWGCSTRPGRRSGWASARRGFRGPDAHPARAPGRGGPHPRPAGGLDARGGRWHGAGAMSAV